MKGNMVVRSVFLLSLCGLLICCGGKSGDGPSNSETTSPPETIGDAGDAGDCPFPLPKYTAYNPAKGPSPESFCPSSCLPVGAVELNETDSCTQSVILGCVQVGNATSDPTLCYRSVADGRVVMAPVLALRGRSGWTECGSDYESRFTSSARCN
jgi:hypothetical protein